MVFHPTVEEIVKICNVVTINAPLHPQTENETSQTINTKPEFHLIFWMGTPLISLQLTQDRRLQASEPASCHQDGSDFLADAAQTSMMPP